MSRKAAPVSQLELSAEARAAAFYEARAAAAHAKARTRPNQSSLPPWEQDGGPSAHPMAYEPAPQLAPTLRMDDDDVGPPGWPPAAEMPRARQSPRGKWGAAAIPEAWVDPAKGPLGFSDPPPQTEQYYPSQYQASPPMTATQPWNQVPWRPAPEPQQHRMEPDPQEWAVDDLPHSGSPDGHIPLNERVRAPPKEPYVPYDQVPQQHRMEPDPQEWTVDDLPHSGSPDGHIPLNERVRAAMKSDESSGGAPATPGWRGSVLMPDTPGSIDEAPDTPGSAAWSSQIEQQIAEGLDREIAELKLRVSELSKRTAPSPVLQPQEAVQQPSPQMLQPSPIMTASASTTAPPYIPPLPKSPVEAPEDLAPDSASQHRVAPATLAAAFARVAQMAPEPHSVPRDPRGVPPRDSPGGPLREPPIVPARDTHIDPPREDLQAAQDIFGAHLDEPLWGRCMEEAQHDLQLAADYYSQCQQHKQSQNSPAQHQQPPKIPASPPAQQQPQRTRQPATRQLPPNKEASRQKRGKPQWQDPDDSMEGLTPATQAKVAAVQSREERRRSTLERAAAIREERRRDREVATDRHSVASTDHPAPSNKSEPAPESRPRSGQDQPVKRFQEAASGDPSSFETDFEAQSKFGGFGKPPPIRKPAGAAKAGGTKAGARRTGAPQPRGSKVAGARRHSSADGPASGPRNTGGVAAHGRKVNPRRSSVDGPRKSDNDGVSTRINFDKRTSRHKNRSHFAANIQRFRQQADERSMVPVKPQDGSSKLWVCVRKRPLFDYEAAKGQFDCISVYPSVGRCVVHNCQMQADMVRMFIKHENFGANATFCEDTTTEQVYDKCTSPLVELAVQGGIATVFMYGQTGSGKTYTMQGLQRMAASQIFSIVGNSSVAVSFFEIAGKSLADLIAPQNVLELRQDAEGVIQVCGAAHVEVTNPDQLLMVLEAGEKRRATHGTDVNSVSSRSHSVLRLEISGGGELMLIDCAGSERKEDSNMHTAERRKEGAQINSSLHSLKECFRAMRTPGMHVPFRGSLLTKVLQQTFTRDDAMAVVLATLSPSPTDIEHSISTLRTVSMLGGLEHLKSETKEDVETHVKRR